MMHKEEAAAEAEAKEEGDDTTSKWIPALWMGPLIPGIITSGLAAIPWIGNYVKLAIFSSFGDEEAKRMAFLGLTPAGAAAQAAMSAAGVDPGAAVAALGAIRDPAKLMKDPSALLSAASKAAGGPNVAALLETAKNPQAALAAASKAAGGPNVGAVLEAAKNPQAALAAASKAAGGPNLGAVLEAAKNPQAALAAAAPGLGAALNMAKNPQAALAAAAPGLGAALNMAQNLQQGGARTEALSTESKVLAGTLFALIVGGGIKGAVDHFVGE
jgi:hypothetical protein